MKKQRYEIQEIIFELIEDREDEIFSNTVCAEVFFPAILGRATKCKMDREWYEDKYMKWYEFYDQDGKHIATQNLTYKVIIEED